ncbi:MAG: hypothetical protein IKB04_04000 [Clostridia bacterium]|nr:hypothetical protein [Clostridia bacterium]
MASVKFTLFADLHYIKGYYTCTPRHLEQIIDRAATSKSEFMMQLGDLTNDIIGSREIVEMYLNNKYGLPAYGIYGNHELECMHHGKADQDIPETMIYVTPYLTNRADEVHWGTPDGKPMADGSIAYYWFERSGFRFVCTDCGYSYNAERDAWEHNRNLYPRTKGNRPTECVGAVQRRWLEEVLTDAAHKNIPCIVFSHPTFYDGWGGRAGDGDDVCAIFDRVNEIRKGTVVAVINGHLHSDHGVVHNNIIFLDINVVLNGLWMAEGEPHYTDDQTFSYMNYDLQGNYLGTEEKPINSLPNAPRTWFFKDPLSCVITATDDGTLTVDGAETEWLHGVEPQGTSKMPRISSRTYKITR